MDFPYSKSDPPAPPHPRRARQRKVSNAVGGARTRAPPPPPVGDFQTGKESERMGKGKGK